MKPTTLLSCLVCLALGTGLGIILSSSKEDDAPDTPPLSTKISIPTETGVEITDPKKETQNIPRIAEAPIVPPPNSKLSNLGTTPDWSLLKKYDNCITRENFVDQIKNVYSINGNWKPWLKIGPDSVTIVTDSSPISITFATAEKETGPETSHFWKNLPYVAPELPSKPGIGDGFGTSFWSHSYLSGLKITIDPGHIGGDWAHMEERFFRMDDRVPAIEGSMTLIVAKHLATKLRSAGASVTLTRTSNHPVTETRPSDLKDYTLEKYGAGSGSDYLQRQSELFFYRTAEIRSRAELINTVYQPDLAICLHFNATAWGDPENPVLLNQQHFHILNNGAYTDNEWAQHDQRFQLLERVFLNIHPTEKAVSQSIIKNFTQLIDLPPYHYDPNSSRARQLDDDGHLWARNLLAGRLYTCPVIFMEPYVMNSRDTYTRIQEGDYQGTKEVNGITRPSIYKEYSEGIFRGIYSYIKELHHQDSSNP